jgi:hypothetical protein
VQERHLPARKLRAHDDRHQFACPAAPAEVRVRAHATHFAKLAGMSTFTGHRGKACTVEHAPILAKLRRARPERPRVGEHRQFVHRGPVVRAEKLRVAR